MHSNSKRPTRFWLAQIITLGAAFLRWHELGQVRTLWDDAYPVAQTIRGLYWGAWPALGQQGTFSFSNPPGQAYFSAIPWLAFGSLWGVFWCVAALNLLAVPLLYRLGRDLWHGRVGLIASFLFAVSPWMIRFGRWTASNSLTPVAATAVLVLALTALARRDAGRLGGAFAVLTAYTQTYMLGLLLMPVQFGAVLACRPRQIRWRMFFAGATLFTVLAGIYLVSIARDWEVQASRLQAFGNAAQGGLQLRDGFLHLATIYVTGREYTAQPLPPGTVPPALETAVRWSSLGLWLLLAGGVMAAGVDLLRRRRGAWRGAAVLGWWLVPIVMLSFATRDPYPWHALTTVPAGHVLAALGLHRLWGQRRWLRWPVAVAGLGLAIVAYGQVHVDAAFNRAHPVQPAATSEALDRLTLRAALRVGAEVRRIADQYDVREYFANLPEPTLAAWSGRPWRTVGWINETDLIVAPLERAGLYVRLGRGGEPPDLPVGLRAATLDLQNGDLVAIDVMPALTRERAARLPTTPVDWPSDTGRTFLGYTWDEAPKLGHAVTLTTFWLVENPPPDAGSFLYAPYLHINTAEGQTRVNTGGQAIEGYYLREGDLLVQPLRVDIPSDLTPGDYGIEIGLYDGVHQVGATFYPHDAAPRPFYSGTTTLRH